MIEEGKIRCVGDCEIPEQAQVIDAEGKYIIPGLIDTHVHYSGNGWGDAFPGIVDIDLNDHPYPEVIEQIQKSADSYHQSYLCSGVTGVFDTGGYAWTLKIRDEANASKSAPYIKSAGPLLTTIPGNMMAHPISKDFSNYMKDPGNVRQEVQQLAELGADAVKLHGLSQDSGRVWLRDNLQAAANEASKYNLPLIANPNQNGLSSAKMALIVGAKLFVYPVEDTLIDQEFIELALENDLVYSSALAVNEGFAEFAARDFREEQIDMECIDPVTAQKAFMTDSLEVNSDAGNASSDVVPKGDPEIQEMRIANLKRAHEAGIKISVGSSAGVPLSLHGQATIYEMETLQKAGFSPTDILVFATQNGAAGMFRENAGQLKAGMVADLVVLNENPLEDISNVRSIEFTVRGGKVWSRKELQFTAN